MDRRLFGANPLSEPVLGYVGTNISEIVIKIRIFHSSKNAFEQVIGEMAVILSRGR